jgi:hypothetical protein
LTAEEARRMKVKTSQETVQELIELLERFDASTEQFLDELPTPEKYAVLAIALIVRGDYGDFEIAYDESMHTVSAQALTKHIMDFPSLSCHLQDALRHKWSDFEAVWTDDGDEEDEA